MSYRLPLALLTGFCCLASLPCDVTDRFQSLPECQQFFYKGQPPSGFISTFQQRVCQRLEGQIYYATLYDRSARLPVYSAFLYKHRAVGRPRGKGVDRSWKYEAQLVNPEADGNMTAISNVVLRDPAVLRSQAVAGGYPMQLGGVMYVRGQLNPANLQGSQASRSATYSVTNALPYPRKFHHEGWKPALGRLARRLQAECPGVPAYGVAGALRWGRKLRREHEGWAPVKGKGRAAIPAFLWVAFCCGNGVSGATLGRCGAPGPLPALGLPPFGTRDLEVGELETTLAAYLGRQRVKIFDGGCTPLSGPENLNREKDGGIAPVSKEREGG